ncbi:MAG: tetratricopeptide repeat protein [Rhodospirillaceae bacterium]|jgi:adenylate cyclase|nr:tetratricopeptide repeat protein [Rhodospirillaceae bacterium]MBT5193492.1 tetratricopeptide repeat protein [Rhodospirillaceae bacterium]MBT5895911.1 tetratricopeptide repeat protein [Rhodospirillaceae bacterium]MBT6428772.1 tetratricopeptide repeat protein [Rhodospirillaceae bacterium]MBT7759603.1 tetratricopeptide repeat protein [Rhodospirillaceae bacterium]
MTAPTRKLAAILAADVAGYSKLMGEDEASTLGALRDLRQGLSHMVVEHRGEVVKSMGDGWLVEFASVVDAVNCALQVQENLANHEIIKLRIGIHIGDIVHEDEDIYGDGVNVAARLQEIAEPGGVALSGRARDFLDSKLANVFRDAGEKQLKNIADAVRVFVSGDGEFDQEPSVEAALPLPDKPSIAVLPFDNMSGDPEQEYFSDGMTEDIITALSRLRWLFVIARNSTFAYKGKAIDIKQVGRELGVRYVLEGSVRKSGNRVRVTAQLIETASGNHLWAERFDRDLQDIFDLQDELTAAISASVDAELAGSERQISRRKSAADLDAWDHFQQGNWHLYKYSKDGFSEAKQHYQAAVARAPEFAGPHAALAYVAAGEVFFGFTKDPAAALEEGLQHGEKAVALDNRDAYSHYALGRICTILGDRGRAVTALEKAIDLNPNFAQAHYGLGFAHLWFGSAEVASDFFAVAIRLSPNDPQIWTFFHLRGFASFVLGNFEAAMSDLQSAKHAKGDETSVHLVSAANFGMMDKVDDARAALGELSRLKRVANIKDVRKRFLQLYAPYVDALILGLRKAGMPEE